MVDVGRAYEIVVSEKRGRGRPLKGLKAVAIRKINVRSTRKDQAWDRKVICCLLS